MRSIALLLLFLVWGLGCDAKGGKPLIVYPRMIVVYEGCEYVHPSAGSGICHSETCPNPIHKKVEL